MSPYRSLESVPSAPKEEVAEKVPVERRDSERMPRGEKLLIWCLALTAGAGIAYESRAEILGSEYGQAVYQELTMSKTEAEIADRLRAEIGGDEVARIELAASVGSAEERAKYVAEHKHLPLEVSGFEKCPGCPTNTQIKEVFEKLPESHRFNVSSIGYNDERVPMPKAYGIIDAKGKTGFEAAHATSSGMVFTKGLTEKSDGTLDTPKNISKFLLESTGHEAAHDADWERNKLLTVAERMTLAQEVINRVNSRDRFKSGYVESIHNPDKQIELRSKMTEYYAEITEAYFSGDPTLSQYDKQIVEQVIHLTNPKYKQNDANQFRLAINKVLADQEHHKAKK